MISNEKQAELWAGISTELSRARGALGEAAIKAHEMGETAVRDQFREAEYEITEWRNSAIRQRQALEGIVDKSA